MEFNTSELQELDLITDCVVSFLELLQQNQELLELVNTKMIATGEQLSQEK